MSKKHKLYIVFVVSFWIFLVFMAIWVKAEPTLTEEDYAEIRKIVKEERVKRWHIKNAVKKAFDEIYLTQVVHMFKVFFEEVTPPKFKPPTRNFPPQIVQASIFPTLLGPGGETKILVRMVDWEGDAIGLDWSTEKGEIIFSEGNQVTNQYNFMATYKAPSDGVPGDQFDIICDYTDGANSRKLIWVVTIR